MGLSLAVGRLWSWSVVEDKTHLGFGAGQFDGFMHYQYLRNLQGGARLWVIAGRPDKTSEFSQAIYSLALRWIKPVSKAELYHATMELGVANMSFYADTAGEADPDAPPLQLAGKGPSAELRYGWGRRYDNLLGLTASAGFRFGALPLGDGWQKDMTLLAQVGVSRSLVGLWPDAAKLCKGLEIGFGLPIAWKAVAATPKAQVFGPYLQRRLLWSLHGDLGIVF